MREIKWLKRNEGWLRQYGIYVVYVLVIGLFLLTVSASFCFILATHVSTELEPSSELPIVTLVVFFCFALFMMVGGISLSLGLPKLKEKFRDPSFRFLGLIGSCLWKE